MPKHSESEDVRLDLYEAPGFAAGRVRIRLDRIIALVDAGCSVSDAIREEAVLAGDEVAEWQRRAARILSYPYARDLPHCSYCRRRVPVFRAHYCPYCGAALDGPEPVAALREVA